MEIVEMIAICSTVFWAASEVIGILKIKPTGTFHAVWLALGKAFGGK